MLASHNGHLEVINRLLDCERTQIRKGFINNLIPVHGRSRYFPVDLMELVVDFAVLNIQK